MKSKNKNLVEKILNQILNVLLIFFGIVLLISIYTSVQTKILKKDYVDFFGYSMFEVQTGSMSGTIEAGDWIVVKLTNKVKLDDIITYKYKNEYITHRIIEVYSDKFVTKGDANNIKDEPIEKDLIVGKVVKTLPSLAILRNIIFNPTVLLTLIITLFLFNLAFKKLKHQKSEEVDKKNLYIKKIFDKIKKIFNFKKGIKIHQINDENKSKMAKEYLEQYLKEQFNQEDGKKYTEEELEKTSLFRVVSVDASEVDDKFKALEKEEELNNTQVYTKITNTSNVIEEEKEEKEDNSLTNVNLELLKNKSSKKHKNIIETAMFIKKEELNEIINIIDEDSKIQPNEKTIKNNFIDAYIDVKYYNFYDGKIITSKNSVTLLKKIIKDIANNMINNSKKNSKYDDLVIKYESMFFLIIALDQNEISKEDFKKEILKYSKKLDTNVTYFYNELISIRKKYSDILNYLLKKLDTNMFDLIIKKFDCKKDMFGLELQHNIAFSKVYSDYIIDKTYSEGIIAEDKMIILFNLLLVQVIKDMMISDFNNQYVLYIPSSLYEKEKKFDKIMKMIDDRLAKSNTIILLTFENLLSYNIIIKKYRKFGYKFGLVLDKEISIKSAYRKNIYIVDYIFINKELKNKTKMLSFIPSELIDNVIYENIINKVGDFGSE